MQRNRDAGMGAGEPAALVHSRAEARLAVATRPPGSRVVSLTPAAHGALVGSGLAVASSDSLLSDRGHARAMVRCLRAADRARAAARAGSLGTAASELLIWRIMTSAGQGACLWEILRCAPAWLLPADGGWTPLPAVAAHARLMARLNDEVLMDDVPSVTLGAGFANALLRLSLRACRPAVMLLALDKGAAQLAEAILAADPAIHVIALARAALNPVESARQSLRTLMRGGGSRLVRATPGASVRRRHVRAAEAILEAAGVDDVASRSLLGLHRLFARQAAETEALVGLLTRLGRTTAVRAAVARDSFKPVGIALAAAAAANGAPCLIASHATVAPWRGAAEARLRGARNRMMTAGPGAAVALAQSPSVARAAQQVSEDIAVVPAPPIIWSGRGTSQASALPLPAAGVAPVFLWAGNYQPWGHRLPWIHDTPDEMVEGLVRLCAAVNAAGDVRMEIRVKPNWGTKGDCDREALERLLSLGAGCTISTEGSFAEAMARSICVISHDSTAIEEAFAARRPVLLWGARGRSVFLDGATCPPQPGRRAAVYAPGWTDDLAGWLSAIARAHRDEPLTDAELDGYVWPAGTTSLQAVAAAIVGRGAAGARAA